MTEPAAFRKSLGHKEFAALWANVQAMYARQSTDTIATVAEDAGDTKYPLSLPYQAGWRNDERFDERLNTVTEFTSKIFTPIPHLGKPSCMDHEET